MKQHHILQKVKFTPDNDSIEADEEKTVEVLVRKATPDYSGCDITASAMYQTKDPQYYLNCSNLQSKKDPVNPVTGKGVGGNWDGKMMVPYIRQKMD